MQWLKLIHVSKSGLWSVYVLTRLYFGIYFSNCRATKIWRLEKNVTLPDKITDYRSKFSYQTLKNYTKTKPGLTCHCNHNGHNWTHGTVSYHCWEENDATLSCDARTSIILFYNIIGSWFEISTNRVMPAKKALKVSTFMYLVAWLSWLLFWCQETHDQVFWLYSQH